jgi:Polysaccharide deacetylase
LPSQSTTATAPNAPAPTRPWPPLPASTSPSTPTGCYSSIWNPLASTLKPLIEAGQVQIGNNTFNHLWLPHLADSQILAQLEQNEEWIERTYGITARP